MSGLFCVVALVSLYTGWVCGRSHERHHHNAGSVIGFRGRARTEGEA